jgi:antitoxin ParD1/3/4
MPMHNVDLTGHYADFVNELVTSGRFSDAGEVMRAGLGLLEQQALLEDEKLVALRSMAAEGFDELDRGQGMVIEGEQQLVDFISATGRRAAEVVENRTAGG